MRRAAVPRGHEIPAGLHAAARQPGDTLERPEIGDETVTQVSCQRLVVGKADVGPLGILAAAVRVEQEKGGMSLSMWREHHAEEANQGDKGTVDGLLEVHAGVLARPVHFAGVDRWTCHAWVSFEL